jgi:hypothetical protein
MLAPPSVSWRFFKARPARNASQAAHFERNGVIIIWEAVHLRRLLYQVRRLLNQIGAFFSAISVSKLDLVG